MPSRAGSSTYSWIIIMQRLRVFCNRRLLTNQSRVRILGVQGSWMSGSQTTTTRLCLRLSTWGAMQDRSAVSARSRKDARSTDLLTDSTYRAMRVVLTRQCSMCQVKLKLALRAPMLVLSWANSHFTLSPSSSNKLRLDTRSSLPWTKRTATAE